MALFEIEVVETRVVRCTYVVEASGLEAAKMRAAFGISVSEEQERRPPDVIHREVGEGRLAEEEQQCA